MLRFATDQACCGLQWEAAYMRFERPDQEVRKFARRLRAAGACDWPRQSRIVELCCGRGNGLRALEDLGFSHLDGIDLSDSLLRVYRGKARLHVCDCRNLPFDNRSRDVVIVQGGLHHLPELSIDLERTLIQAQRVLRPGGRFVAIEPWPTPFLSAVHMAMRIPPARALWPKLDAFARMVEMESETYFNWLSSEHTILRLLHRYFRPERCLRRWGKLLFVGRNAYPCRRSSGVATTGAPAIHSGRRKNCA
jgi:ubiquinone/menaquinone biosynthesis C-methylase UbiE